MVFHSKISTRTRAYVCYLRKEGSLSYQEISKKCNISVSSAVRICKETTKTKEQKKRTGRPPIMSRRDKKRFIRTFQKLRNENPNVTVVDVAKECRIVNVSDRTLVRVMNENGHKSLRPMQKGLLSVKDRKRRVRFARNALKKYDPEFWTNDVLLYLDGVSFVHKHNPYNDALTPRGKIWRRPSESLQYTTKGSKNLPGGRRLHLLVGIGYTTGVVIAEEYKKFNAAWFAKFVQKTLHSILSDCAVSKNKERLIFLMDNDPSQRSKLATDALHDVGAEVLEIPPRSPDLNPIENVFNNVKSELVKQALQGKIEKESFDEFRIRVLQTIVNCNSSTIDTTIATMHDRLRRIAKNGGYRTKY